MAPCYADKNEYAVSSWMFEDVDLEVALKTIGEAGFAHVELWGDTIHLDPRWKIPRGDIAGWLKRYRLEVHSLHMPFRNFPHFDDRSEGEAWRLRLWKQSIDDCAALGVPIAVVHAVNRHEYNYGYDRVSFVHDTLAELCSYGRSRGVSLALENIASGDDPGAEILCTLVEQSRRFGDIKDLRYCLDIGHVTLTSNDMKAEIDACIDRLITLHIHNNDGQSDSHETPDKGVIDWPRWYAYIRKGGYKGLFVLEIYSGKTPFERMRRTASLFADAGRP
jgi:sugar phosphate isomerase/epimerase